MKAFFYTVFFSLAAILFLSIRGLIVSDLSILLSLIFFCVFGIFFLLGSSFLPAVMDFSIFIRKPDQENTKKE